MEIVVNNSCAQPVFGDARYIEHFVLNPDLKIVNVGILVIGVLPTVFHHTR